MRKIFEPREGIAVPDLSPVHELEGSSVRPREILLALGHAPYQDKSVTRQMSGSVLGNQAGFCWCYFQCHFLEGSEGRPKLSDCRRQPYMVVRST